MTQLTKHKSPIEYGFHQWLDKYPTSEEWKARIKKEPSVKGYPNIKKFYQFVKTILQQGNVKNWKNWDYIQERILESKPKFNQSELKILGKIFKHLIEYNKAPAFKKGIYMDPNKK